MGGDDTITLDTDNLPSMDHFHFSEVNKNPVTNDKGYSSEDNGSHGFFSKKLMFLLSPG